MRLQIRQRALRTSQRCEDHRVSASGLLGTYPAEIERVLVEHPAVAAVAVAAVPDAMKGELACAYVVLRPAATATEQDVIAFTEGRLAAYKRPRLVRFLADLPKTSSGKIMRRELIKSFTP